MVLITIIVLYVIFAGSMMLGTRLSKKSSVLRSAGEKILKNKEDQLEGSPLFKPVRTFRESGASKKISLFLFLFILLKSIAFFFISIFQIAPLVIFFQGLLMGSLMQVVKEREDQASFLLKVTYWQALSQVTAGGMGTWLGYHWLIGTSHVIDWSWFSTIESWVWIFVTIITGYLAARFEADMLVSEANN